MPEQSLSLLAHPSIPLLVAALLVAIVPRRAASVALVAAPLVTLGLVAAGRGNVSADLHLYGVTLWPLRLDDLAAVFAGAFAVAVLLANVFGLATSTRLERAAGLVTAAAAIGVAVAGDLVMLFVWWEVKAVASTVLVLAANSERAAGAALRYLYLHLIGGALLLGGITWHLAETGTSTFVALDITPATAMIAAGFLVAAAAVPLHGWLPDAYPAATFTGTVLLSAFTTKAAVYALARGFAGVEFLVWVGVAMSLYGVVFAMLQDDLRRLLSYHIVSQVGFMVAAIGVGTTLAVNGAAAHAAAHIIYKGLLLMGVGAVIHSTGRRSASQLGSLAKVLPWVLVLYLIGAASISGVPLLSGFVSKELTIHALDDSDRLVAVVLLKIAAVGTLLSTLGKLPYATWIAPPQTGERVPVLRRPAASMYVAMTIAAAVCIVVGLVPGLLWDQLPYAQSYSPYYSGKVVETLQLLGVAGLGFWLLRRQLAPHPGVVLDVDWLAARTPALAAPAFRALDGAASRWSRTATSAGAWFAARHSSRPAWTTRPTWWVGTVIVLASAAAMIGSVWR